MTTFTLIRVDGHLAGPWAIGSAGHDVDLNIPILQDPHTRRPLLPATTLVGALRAHLSNPVAWLGPEPDDTGAATDEQRTPSRLWALGTTLDASAADIDLQQRTAIDGWSGAAGGTTLRSETFVNRHRTGFRWAICHDGSVDTPLLDELASWRCEIGARRTSGLGQLIVDEISVLTIDLADAAQLTWWLTQRDDWLRGTGDAVTPPVPVVHRLGSGNQPPEVETWTWRIVDPLHVGTGEVARDDPSAGSGAQRRSTRVREFRRAPSAGPSNGRDRLEIPGSAWKGIFRHRLSTILRVCGTGEQEVDAVVRVLFGHHGDRGPSGPVGQRRRGRLRFQSSVVEGVSTLTRTHVAIDRISGGAAESKLFTIKSVPDGAATLRIDGMGGLPEAVRNLLHHVVWDIHEGLVGVGAFTTRGYGTLALAGAPPPTAPVDIPAITDWAVVQTAAPDGTGETA